MHQLSGADGIVFMVAEEKISEREVVKEDEKKLSETDVAKEDEERVSLRIIANEYISNHLKGDFPRFSKVPPIMFVRFKKYPEGPDEHMSDRDEGDDSAALGDADGLETQGAKTSVATILTTSSRNIQISLVPDGLIYTFLLPMWEQMSFYENVATLRFGFDKQQEPIKKIKIEYLSITHSLNNTFMNTFWTMLY